MKLEVNQDCCSCSYCYRTCPVGAPFFDGEQTRINNETCISCGKCVKACPMGAIYDTEKPLPQVEKHEKIVLTCDAVMIGAGASGMTAAVRMAERGKKIIVLEKAKNTGSGAMHVAGPMQIIDTKWALDAGEAPKAPQVIQDAIEYGDGLLDPQLIENTVYALPRFFDWMCSFTDMTEGFALVDAKPMMPPPMPAPEFPDWVEIPQGEQETIIAGGGMPGSAMGGKTGLVVEAKHWNHPGFHNAGEYIMKRLFARAEELGVIILRETCAKSFVKDEKGRFVAVLAEDPGGVVEVRFGTCLVATGSLLLSEAVKKAVPEFAGCFEPRYGHTINTYTGDGFAMCEAAGIPTRYEDIWLNITGSLVMPCDGLTVEYAQAANKKPMMPPDLRDHANRPEALVVNLDGHRYENEQMASISYMEQMRQPQGLSYAIYTEELIRSQPLPWIPVTDENGKIMRTMMPAGMPARPWNEEHFRWLDSLKGNHLIIANTLDELAQRAGMPAEALNATVARYNTQCAQGEDQDFGKHRFYLKSLDHGPYYAVKKFLMSDGAEGGIPIDATCRVKGSDSVVPNLFAAGDNSSGNIVIRENGEKVWITNEFSWALSSGMIAADGMLEELACAAD